MINEIYGSKILKKFKSKKNDVYLIEDGTERYILKKFTNRCSYDKEKEFYLILDNSKAKKPRLIKYDDDKGILLIEYIQGNILLQELEQLEKKCDKESAIKLLINLIVWIQDFQNVRFIKENKLVFNDVNFRNFIVKDGQIYGVDFETVQEGQPYEDKVKVLSMYLYYKPVNSLFKKEVVDNLMSYLVNREGFNKHILLNQIYKQIEIIKERRTMSIVE